MCSNLWFSEAGDRIYTACGTTFSSDADIAQDMRHTGSVPVTESGNFYPNIVWLDDSSALAKVAYLDAGHCDGSGGQDCDTLPRIVDDASGVPRSTWWLPPVFVDGVPHGQHGLFVFHVADGSLRMIGRAVVIAEPAQAYYIDAPVAGGNNTTLQRTTSRRAAAR